MRSRPIKKNEHDYSIHIHTKIPIKYASAILEHYQK